MNPILVAGRHAVGRDAVAVEKQSGIGHEVSSGGDTGDDRFGRSLRERRAGRAGLAVVAVRRTGGGVPARGGPDVGTVAGDDTIFLAIRDGNPIADVVRRFEGLMGRGRTDAIV